VPVHIAGAAGTLYGTCYLRWAARGTVRDLYGDTLPVALPIRTWVGLFASCYSLLQMSVHTTVSGVAEKFPFSISSFHPERIPEGLRLMYILEPYCM
jgi:hypothetical protein